MVDQTLNCRDMNIVYLLIPRDTNDDLMVLIKGFEQDPDLGVKIVHLSIDDDIEAIKMKQSKIMRRMPQRHHMMLKI